MVNEKLRKKMSDAYTTGDYDTALKLSQKLDKQILSHYPDKRKTRTPSKPRNKEKTKEI